MKFRGKSEMVRKLEQIRVYPEGLQEKRVNFATLLSYYYKISECQELAKRSVLSVVHCKYFEPRGTDRNSAEVQ
jgi:hypothetical protein